MRNTSQTGMVEKKNCKKKNEKKRIHRKDWNAKSVIPPTLYSNCKSRHGLRERSEPIHKHTFREELKHLPRPSKIP